MLIPLVLATTNPGKAREMAALLACHPVFAAFAPATPDALNLALPDIEETGTTFADNARLKAIAVARATRLPALADDSGLCVDALGGAPGLHSARWAGPNADDLARMHLLLARLRDVPEPQRTARFVCAVTLARPDGRCITAQGICEGEITMQPRGTDGFGYDPIFYLPALSRTLAELSADEKNKHSHRAHAIAQLAEQLQNFLP